MTRRIKAMTIKLLSVVSGVWNCYSKQDDIEIKFHFERNGLPCCKDANTFR